MVGMQMNPALGWQSQGSFMEVLGQQDWKKKARKTFAITNSLGWESLTDYLAQPCISRAVRI